MQQSTAKAILLKEIQSVLRTEKLDGWLLYDFRGTNVLAERIMDVPKHLTRSRRCLLFIPASGDATKIVHRIEEGNLDHWPGRKVVYLSWQSLELAIRDAIGTHKRIAMEYSPKNSIPYVSKVDAGTLELVRATGTQVVSSADLIQYFEARWDDEQLNDNVETARHLREIVDATFKFIRLRLNSSADLTEYDVQQFMMNEFERRGLETDSAPNCSVNANSANPHYEPTKDIFSPIQKGDFVLIDLWAKKRKPRSVFADITWVGYVGETVPGEYAKVFKVVAEARDAALETAKKALSEGKPVFGYQVDNAARKVITDAGFGEYFIHRTGHSIGQEVHANGANMDDLETHDERRLIPSTSFTIEPGIYFPGRFGIRSEIDVFITSKGEAIVTGEPRQTEVIPILK